MSNNPIRIMTAALSNRIYAGRLTKDGKQFKEPRYDVTSDVLQAIVHKIGMNNEVNVVDAEAGRVAVIRVLSPEYDDAIGALPARDEFVEALDAVLDLSAVECTATPQEAQARLDRAAEVVARYKAGEPAVRAILDQIKAS